ncbi:FKBP-type peptidyl-prolyl cis-trans isomerase [Marivirga atlantica]|uniref:Peptidyl-prolyl cis-trans isomerase n=1 Tax=Marivirga atlantica TaxID=1548457 RepID=A0A937DHR3_9BACT|nr:FKBP-type peptidyl-prolyl cis-trans isomerase [Marivirga atlantica]MBL0764270.1 FKBP-type peptidyl-prolyl cis-trans isomerase [Marivirga atlantica]
MKRGFLLLIIAIAFTACDKECTNEFGECPEKQLKEDLVIIESYLEDNNLEAEVHSSGLHYIIEEEGTGEKPNNGQQVVVDYVGRFLDGRVFDTSIDSVARAEGVYNENRNYQPFQFTLGVGAVVSGWDIGIALLNEGSKAQFILPSYLGYGSNGSGGTIPANTVIMFEVELIDIKF